MAVRTITIDEALAQPSPFDTLIDARSPSEFAEDALPGAVNWPVLDDEQRRVVGTEFKQVAPLEARKRGAACVARNIADLIERHLGDKPRDWQPLVYCWRGGQRSGTLAWFLGQIGYRTAVLQGGYKAFRARVRADLDHLPGTLRWVVVAGRTGSGKSRLLQTLARQGAQVLDLEDLARHRGSVLGALPDQAQPAQKRFETAIWDRLRRFDPARPVYVESESRKIGLLQVPQALILHMRADGQRLMVDMPRQARVELLLQDYAHFQADPEGFCGLMRHFTELRGHERVAHWQQLARQGLWATVFGELIDEHYDPLYLRSMGQNYVGGGLPIEVTMADGQDQTLHTTAQGLIERLG